MSRAQFETKRAYKKEADDCPRTHTLRIVDTAFTMPVLARSKTRSKHARPSRNAATLFICPLCLGSHAKTATTTTTAKLSAEMAPTGDVVKGARGGQTSGERQSHHVKTKRNPSTRSVPRCCASGVGHLETTHRYYSCLIVIVGLAYV